MAAGVELLVGLFPGSKSFYSTLASKRGGGLICGVGLFAGTYGNNNNQKEDEHSGVLVSWRLTTLAKLSVDVSHVFSHKLRRKGLQ